jgi:transposase
VPKTYRAYSPSQSFLLPPSPMDWLPEDHLAFFVLDVVKELDLRSIHAHYERDHRGAAPYDPRMMVALLLYAYCMGTPSSRRIERKTHEDVAFRVICGGQQPDHTRISEFRRIHLKALSALFFQVLRLCQAAGLVQLGHVAIDGTKVKANASKHKAMSYDRMQKAEAELQAKVKLFSQRRRRRTARTTSTTARGSAATSFPRSCGAPSRD